MLTKLFVTTLLFTTSLFTPAVFATATYRATGRAVEVSSTGLLLPPSVGSPGTVFSLEYSLDETQVPTDGGGDAFFRADSFAGFVGDEIAFSGTGLELEFYRDFDSFSASYYVSPQSSLQLQGIAADLISVSGLFVDIDSSAELVNGVVDSREFPVEQAVGSSGDWSFSAEGLAGGAIEIRGILDDLVLVSGPAAPTDGGGMDGGGMDGGGMDGGGMDGGGMDGGGMDGGGMDGGGMDGGGMDGGGMDGGGMDGGGMDGGGMDGGGMDGGGMDGGGMNGGGAVPEPSSALIWLTLGAIVAASCRRKTRNC